MTVTPKTIEIKSWDDFSGVVFSDDVTTSSHTRFAFRGQSNAEWKLTPSIARVLKGYSLKSAIKIETLGVEEFVSQSHTYYARGFEQDDQYIWSLMQHHGAPTRCLDWSSSPFVALYFAVADQSGSDAAVWAVDIHKVTAGIRRKHQLEIFPPSRVPITDLQSPDPKPLIFFGSGQFLTERMIAQQSLHSICYNPLLDHDDVISNFIGDEDEDAWRKVVIGARYKQKFLRRLRKMNISANALFPGIDGIGRSVRELMSVLPPDLSPASLPG